MKPHNELYVLAEHCPKCGMVPLREGHSCGEDFYENLCPYCGEEVSGINQPDWDDCPNCPFCADCCEYLIYTQNLAIAVAEGGVSYTGTDEHSIRYVNEMLRQIDSAKAPDARLRMEETLWEFILAEAFAPEAIAEYRRKRKEKLVIQ